MKSILDPTFRYTSSANTDLRKTFARIRRESRRQAQPPARVFVVLYAVLELFLGVTGSQEGVAHFAHLGGMIGGYLVLRFWRGGMRRPYR